MTVYVDVKMNDLKALGLGSLRCAVHGESKGVIVRVRSRLRARSRGNIYGPESYTSGNHRTFGYRNLVRSLMLVTELPNAS